jgi:hypothetical protein
MARTFTLGAVRGGPVRRQADKPRARLLQRRRSTRRRQPGYVVGRPQARPPSPPHLERGRRGGVPGGMSPRPARWRPFSDDLRGLFPPVTAASYCWAGRIERAAALISPVGHPTSRHVAGHKPRPAHRNKSGRPRARTTQVGHLNPGVAVVDDRPVSLTIGQDNPERAKLSAVRLARLRTLEHADDGMTSTCLPRARQTLKRDNQRQVPDR